MTALSNKPSAAQRWRELVEATEREHALIRAHVDALLSLAETIDRSERDQFAALFEAECHFLTEHLVPHIADDEHGLYAELDQLLARRHSMRPMREEHAQICRLIEALAGLRQSVAADTLDAAGRHELRHSLYRLYGVLRTHMDEEERYVGVIRREGERGPG